MRWPGLSVLLLLFMCGCAPAVEDPGCWTGGGGTLVLPPVTGGGASSLEGMLSNGCDRQLEVIRVTLSQVRCEGACPEVMLASVPALPVRVPARGVLEVSLKATAPAPVAGRTESVLVVTTGEVDSPENQAWTVVASSVP